MDREYGPRFSLEELMDATGVPRRSVRFYIAEGLVPPAAGRGRYSYYTASHVEALTKIRELRQRNLSIDEIRQTLASEKPALPEPAPGIDWRRIQLHPDLELHVRSEAPEHIQTLARQIQVSAQRWFGDSDDDHELGDTV